VHFRHDLFQSNALLRSAAQTAWVIIGAAIVLAGCGRQPANPAPPAAAPGGLPKAMSVDLAPWMDFQDAAVWTCTDGSIRLALLESSIPAEAADPAGLQTWLESAGIVVAFTAGTDTSELRPINDVPAAAFPCPGNVAVLEAVPGVVPAEVNERAVVDAARASIGLGDSGFSQIVASPDGKWSAVVISQSFKTSGSFPILGGNPVHLGPLHLFFAPRAGQQPVAVALQASEGDWSLVPLGWTADGGFCLLRAESRSARRLWLVPSPKGP